MQGRSGLAGPGQNKAFKFGGSFRYKDSETAVAAAKKWLADIGC